MYNTHRALVDEGQRGAMSWEKEKREGNRPDSPSSSCWEALRLQHCTRQRRAKHHRCSLQQNLGCKSPPPRGHPLLPSQCTASKDLTHCS